MDVQSSPWTVEQIGELWEQSYRASWDRLLTRLPGKRYEFPRMHAKARSEADKRTRELVAADEWSAFTASRERAKLRDHANDVKRGRSLKPAGENNARMPRSDRRGKAAHGGDFDAYMRTKYPGIEPF